jgi:hypothetical protein
MATGCSRSSIDLGRINLWNYCPYSDSHIQLGLEVKVMVFNATLKIAQLYCGTQFYCWRKPEYPVKNNDLPQVTDKLDQSCIEYTSPWVGFKITTLLVVGNDCIGSKSNYHTITTMMAPQPLVVVLVV